MQIYTGDTASLISSWLDNQEVYKHMWTVEGEIQIQIGPYFFAILRKQRGAESVVLSMELTSISPWIAQVFPKMIHTCPLALKKVIVSTYGAITAWC